MKKHLTLMPIILLATTSALCPTPEEEKLYDLISNYGIFEAYISYLNGNIDKETISCIKEITLDEELETKVASFCRKRDYFCFSDQSSYDTQNTEAFFGEKYIFFKDFIGFFNNVKTITLMAKSFPNCGSCYFDDFAPNFNQIDTLNLYLAPLGCTFPYNDSTERLQAVKGFCFFTPLAADANRFLWQNIKFLKLEISSAEIELCDIELYNSYAKNLSEKGKFKREINHLTEYLKLNPVPEYSFHPSLNALIHLTFGNSIRIGELDEDELENFVDTVSKHPTLMKITTSTSVLGSKFHRSLAKEFPTLELDSENETITFRRDSLLDLCNKFISKNNIQC